jgi:HD-GYP domain-containing protein (c-di-GMP phosphodiesterase class II)
VSSPDVQLATGVRSPIPERLSQRLESLGITLVLAQADGRVSPQGKSQWLERLIVETAPFAAAVRGAWSRLAEGTAGAGQVVEVWPGVWLVPLPGQRRRRVTSGKAQAQLPAALLLGGEFLSSDQLRLVCDTQRLDFQSTVARIDPSLFVSHSEAMRLASMLAWMQQDSLEVDRRSSELQTMSSQLGESYEELSLLYKLSTSMGVSQPPAEFLSDACRELRQVVGLQWMALTLTDEPRLNELSNKVFTAGELNAPASLLKWVGTQLLQRPQGSDYFQPQIIDDTQSLKIDDLPQLARDLLIVPMLREGKPFGVLFGGNKLDGNHISSVDSKLCSSLVSSLSIFLENRMLFEDMSAMFMGTLHALTSSIDAKDRYTKGHSERVAMMSRRLAAAAGLSPELVERVYISGLVHDVGKIGVPEAVLCKPGKLTDEEFALIKLHPEIGARILRDIRQMSDLIPGVLYHHERWDGRGYPHKVAGKEIPLFGRLICLADSFDAMSSNRTYRRSLQLDHVLGEIRRCAGTQFDPELAELFVKLDFTDFLRMVEEHQKQAESPQGSVTTP